MYSIYLCRNFWQDIKLINIKTFYYLGGINMAKRRLKAVLALVVAMLFVFQTVPMYSFAEQANQNAEVKTEQTVSNQTDKAADNQDETELNYMIDENGNQVDLTDEMREKIYNDDSASTDGESSGLYAADTDSFFEYDSDEVEVAASYELVETFDECNIGDTSIPGWDISIVSKGNNQANSTISVQESTKGNALKLNKVANGATNGTFAAGDEALYAVHQFANPMQGNIVISADVYVEKAARLGLFFYGKSDDIMSGLTTGTDADVPYLGRAFLWDNGSDKVNPADAAPNGIITWDNNSKNTNTSVKWVEKQWYTLTISLNTETGKYSFSMTDESGNVINTTNDLALTASVLTDDPSVYGIGFNIQNDVKTMGSCFFKNITVIDDNSAEEDARILAADKKALAALPDGVVADSITEDFDLAITGPYGSSVTWTSSNPDVIAVDENGHVTVTRPDFSGNGGVAAVLSAHLVKGLASTDLTISVQVLEKTPTKPSEIVEGDKAVLQLPSTVKQTMVTEGFQMPTSGTFGSVITYISSNENLLSVDNATGKVTVNKPPFTGAVTQPVTLTAMLKSGNVTDTKSFELDIREADPVTDYEKAVYDANNAFIGGIDINNVRQDSFILSDAGSYGSLSWTTSDASHIDIKENYIREDEDSDDDGMSDTGEAVNDGGYKAVVTRPDRNEDNAKVILTVTANVNGATASKEFELTVIAEDALKAYPGVEGYGAYSKGGRGGQVYHVTTLAHDGEGSLTYGLEQVKGARTIVFDVGGVIDLTDLGRPITIKGEKYSNVTVAGQTAPYPGITLKGFGLTVSSAHDVIIRNIRIRIGDVFADNEVNQSDPLSIGSSKQVIIDHCTLQWAIDMDFRVTGEYVTISNTIMGKSLSANSPHEKGGHAYVGMINEGARKVTYAKNFVGDSTQRSPRITDADWIDSYNCLLYNCGNGYDLYNYEWQNKNAKMNVHNNYARMGPSVSNATPFRAGRGRNYSGGIMAYFKGNYKGNAKDSSPTSVSTAKNAGSIKTVLNFGSDNKQPGTDYDLSNVTLDEWNNNPASYDNMGKNSVAATLTYMTYPFPAPRGDVMNVVAEDGSISLVNYAIDDNGMGVTRPARDLYDTMILKEMKLGGTYNKSNIYSLKASMKESEVTPFFEELERRTGLDYSEYKTAREWYVKQGEGPTLKGAASAAGSTKPVHWDDYTDVNVNTNPDAASKYDEHYTTTFEVGDWWGEYCGSPGQQEVYTLYDEKLGRTVTTTDPDYDQTRYSLVGIDTSYIATERTVADLYPADWVKEDYPEIAEFMDNYRKKNYAGKPDNYKITWDGMGDGIPNWYKEYRGWSRSQYLSSEVDPETGYTYLEEYLQFMADDQPLDADDTPASIESFKVNNLGYSTAQVFWNTDFRTTCVLEYGTEPGNYTKSEVLTYDATTDYYHTYHAQTLVDLEPDTQYYYKVTATDENSTQTVAEYDPNDPNEKNMTFKTTVAPEGSEDLMPDKPVVTKTVPYLNQVRINWTGNVATDESYEIYYDTTDYGDDLTSYAHKLTGIDARTNKFIVTGLDNNVTYYFVVAAVNSNGRTASDVVSDIPTGVLIDFDFTKMTAAEKKDFMENEYMYVLGGSVSMQKDPDTGENVLQQLDETNSHGVQSDLKFAVTQDEKFTYEVKMKVLYQKQTDNLNKQKNVDTIAADEHNTLQLNFYKDALMTEDKDSTNAALWDSVFSIFLDSESKPISETNGRFDGTTEIGTIKFGSTPVGSYNSGRTVSPDIKNRVLPSGTGYASSIYKNTTVYGDAKYSNIAETDKTLHGIWYYELGSAKFVTYRIVVDPLGNNVKIYADGEPVYELGTFSEDIEEPYNVGKVQIKSRNDGYSWLNIASIKAYSGDGKSDINIGSVPQGGGTSGGSGGSGGGAGGSGGSGTSVTPAPAATDAPAASAEPTVEPVNPETSKYFDDLGNVQWAVESINALAEKGIITGTGDRQFSPEANVTRAEYVTMLMRAYGNDVAASDVDFNDVSTGEWYYEPIAKALTLGVVNGYDNGNFGINDNISREDMMVMAYRTMNALNLAVPKIKEYENFGDQNAISDYAVEAIESMYCAGIINGVGNNLLDPKGNADRAQSAKIIYGLTNMEGTVNE